MSCNCGCGGIESCGCCAGTEILTPQTIGNRPGLDAINYRVGNHPSFLSTMKARLSGPQYASLNALKTRLGSDFAIALLDGWAAVGDVLTFYQERIANEGYLRTATERRSVLELARLIGYVLKPGVASSTYLAYALDKPIPIPVLPGVNAKPVEPPDEPVTIPAGSRVQSVPGPGELPQSFETSQDVIARSSWNDLQVRLTQPQVINDQTRIIYLKGAPGLKPGDPILIIASPPKLFRVESVTPQPEADRTRITVSPWLRAQTTTPLPGGSVSPSHIKDIIDRFRQPERFGVPPSGKSATEIVAVLNDLDLQVAANVAPEALKTKIEQETLPLLEGQHSTAVAGNFTRVRPWLEDLIRELENAVKATPAPGITAAPIPAQNRTIATDLGAVLPSLVKPPSVPPIDPQHLPRSFKDSLSIDGDLVTQMLTQINPGLQEVLYKAWENVPVTAPETSEVHALRTRASLFGHNAPPELSRNSAGVITGTKEWDLHKVTSTRAEAFDIQLQRQQDDSFNTIIALDRNTSTPKSFTIGQPARFEIKDANERVDVQATQAGHELTIPFKFTARPIALTLTVDLAQMTVNAKSTGATPVTITEARITPNQEIVVTGRFQQQIQTNTEEADVVWLDAAYDQIRPDSSDGFTTEPDTQSWIVVERPNAVRDSNNNVVIPQLVYSRVLEVNERSRTDYGVAFKSTRILLESDWLDQRTDTFAVIRESAVFAQSEKLELAEEPIETTIAGDEIELDGIYDGLQSGRWLIVTGERADVTVPLPGQPTGSKTSSPVPGVPAVELVMLASVSQKFKRDLPGDKTHTFLKLATPLAYSYKRDTVVVYGNVVNATHGETRQEILGNGDAGKELQQFTLKQFPLTFLAAPTPAGAETTLQVRVNDVLWHETDSLASLAPNDHGYITRTDDEDKTSIIFGTGDNGARLPTGLENVSAKYRNGIGAVGNVKANQISLLASQPLGVKAVTNPFPATGGADREDRDQARVNAPLAVMALDRLVSTQDYADFARTFAGIGKASAARLSDGLRRLVHITIAGADDVPIKPTSELQQNLTKALRDFGDPYLPLLVVTRTLKLLVIQAKVRVLPDYLWEKIEPKVRQALLDAFNFRRMGLGDDVLLSRALSVIQRVEGVEYIDIDKFDVIDESEILQHLSGTESLADLIDRKERIPVALARVDYDETDPSKRIKPAELVYLSPKVPDTVILAEITS